MFGIENYLLSGSFSQDRARFLQQPREPYCAPGYWTCVSVYAREHAFGLADLHLPADRIDYAKAIGIEKVLYEVDTYPRQRRRQAENYSPLIVLDDQSQTDKATQDINGCIRALFPEAGLSGFVADLCDVVGDMHDNVWSHGLKTGVSMAQRWKKNADAAYIEFALADAGHGFLRELIRSGVANRNLITTDEQAIGWCIQKGNSSKLKPDDGWSQRLPSDAMGNPIGKDAKPREKENNHLGIGLHKLVQLVKNYGGQLWLASGRSMLCVATDGLENYVVLPQSWEGVALACRFASDRVLQRLERHRDAEPDEFDKVVAELLGGP